jgi:acetyl esterase
MSRRDAEALEAFREAENRRRASALIRVITGFPDRGATIRWQPLALPDRELQVRVYRPSSGRGVLPLVLHVHGGGFVGTAVQSDWVNSHLAARLPAVVVPVEHRLLAPGVPLSAAVDDGWDVLRHVVRCHRCSRRTSAIWRRRWWWCRPSTRWPTTAASTPNGCGRPAPQCG